MLLRTIIITDAVNTRKRFIHKVVPVATNIKCFFLDPWQDILRSYQSVKVRILIRFTFNCPAYNPLDKISVILSKNPLECGESTISIARTYFPIKILVSTKQTVNEKIWNGCPDSFLFFPCILMSFVTL